MQKQEEKLLDIIKDGNLECYSVILTTTKKEYLNLVEQAYKDKGGIKGQRDALKTSSAIRIRQRMINDLQNGAVIPPIVIGVVIDDEKFNSIEEMNTISFSKFVSELPKNSISIIDGMQRTTALTEIDNNDGYNLRIEYWISKDANSLIYRMLVLNTGQVPWNIRRQVEVVFDSLIEELKIRIDKIKIFKTDDKKRRTVSGSFQANQIIELYLVFGARKERINTQEKLADEFVRLDFIEATSNNKFTEIFCDALRILVELDISFGKLDNKESDQKFSSGKDLFRSQPAQVGLVTAISIEVMGRPGSSEKSRSHQEEALLRIKNGTEKLLDRLNLMNTEQLRTFLDFETLNTLLSAKTSGAVGDYERAFFLKAFHLLLEQNFDVESMTVCWRAY
jgi:hypothetical protein